MEEVIIDVKRLEKRFPGVVALVPANPLLLKY